MTTPRHESANRALIVKHPACPQWGLGVLVEERDGKRIFNFEDGLSHSIAQDFWGKLESVTLDGAAAEALVSRLASGRERSASSAKKAAKKVAAPPKASFAEQLAQFEKDYPGGFLAAVYVAKERGQAPAEGEIPTKKSKAPIEPAQAAARALLAKSALGKGAAAYERVRTVHKAATGLLHPLGDVIPFEKLAEARTAAAGDAVAELLHGGGDAGARLERYAAALAKDKLGSWPLASILPALLDPANHVFVKSTVYEKQAAVLKHALAFEKVPSVEGYGALVALAKKVKAELEANGQAPRDYLDVYTFMARTLK